MLVIRLIIERAELFLSFQIPLIKATVNISKSISLVELTQVVAFMCVICVMY